MELARPLRSRQTHASARPLMVAATVFAVAFVVHGADHAIRGLTGDDHHAAWPGWFQLIMSLLTVLIGAATVVFVVTGYRHAPLVCAIVGVAVSVLFPLLHGIPSASHAIDSFVSADHGARVTGFSWVTGTVGTLSALVLGVLGIRAWRLERLTSSTTAAQSSGQGE